MKFKTEGKGLIIVFKANSNGMGSINVTVNGKTTEIARQYHIIDMMLDVRAGDVVTLKILRGGEEQTVSITITKECLAAY